MNTVKAQSRQILAGANNSRGHNIPKGARPVPGWKGCAAAPAASSTMAASTIATCKQKEHFQSCNMAHTIKALVLTSTGMAYTDLYSYLAFSSAWPFKGPISQPTLKPRGQTTT